VLAQPAAVGGGVGAVRGGVLLGAYCC